MTYFSINTHHAYLNSDVVLQNKMSSSIVVKDSTTSEEWTVQNELSLHLCAGIHKLVSGQTEHTIIIEDAVKFGGSQIKEAFVFDNNPWVFITMKDRFYIVNIETGEEKVEHTITPNSIKSLGKYYGKPCECFLFNTKKDYSIYNVETGTILTTFSNHIYSNNHLVIFRSNDKVVVYDYRQKKTLVEFEGQYSFGKKFYFVKDGKLKGLNLSSSYINNLAEIGVITDDHLLYGNYLIKLKSDYLLSKTYELFDLGNGEKNIKSTSFKFPYYIESWLGHSLNRLSKMREEYEDFQKGLSGNNSFPNVKHHIFCIKISGIRYEWERKEHVINLTGEVMSYPSTGIVIPFTLSGVEESSINFNKCVIGEGNNKTNVDKPEEATDITVELPKGEKLLGKSSSGNLVVSISGNNILYRNVEDDTKMPILRNLFDSSHYINAYFTSDGKNVIFENQNKEFNILGFEDLSFDKFDIEGMSVPRQAGFNGYKPEIDFADSRKPVWRDPISLVKVKPEEFSNHIFMSSDGTFFAQNNFKIIVRNRITQKDITDDEYQLLSKEFDFNWNDSDEDKENKITRRKKLLEDVGKNSLFKLIIDRYSHLIRSSSHIPESKKEKHLLDVVSLEIEEYIHEKERFTPLFLDKLGYVIYQNTKTHEEKRILIGRSVYFLNYVSFSYDSRYLAFGAKMKRDDFRLSEDGVFVLYDLQKEEVVIRQDNGQNLYAVWMTMFSREGNVAFYDSKADAYMITKESEFKEVQKINGKSLLCFSPSGKYIAFSDQNYIDYTHHPDANWGHQPSGNIFIHATNDVQVCLEQYNDFGEGIIGVVSHAGSVASAAFSSDERRLLAVGGDGVVVVRNLHLDEVNEKINYCQSECENSHRKDIPQNRYGTHYGEFAGSYAQDVMGYSDDVINDAFDGDPDAYWNID